MTRRPAHIGLPRRFAVATVGIAAAASAVVSPAAWGHEFGLALVVDPSGAPGSPGPDARDGFRLAVDESPDVSHAPGEDGGDHLGGVDVEIVVVEPAPTAAATEERVRDAVLAGASVVVTIPSDVTNSTTGAGFGGAGVLLLQVGAGAPPTGAPPAPSVVALHDSEAGGVDGSGAERFARAFLARYGRPASAWAERGYDAARVLDAAVAELGPHGRDPVAIAEVANASAGLIRSTAVASPGTPSPGVAGTTAPGHGGRSPGAAVTLAAGSALLVAIVCVVTVRRRRRRPAEGASYAA